MTHASRVHRAGQADACDGGTQDEIKVTSEMVSAGVSELGPCELRPYQDEAEVLGRVFRAMLNLWPDYLLQCEQDEQLGMTSALRDRERP
jgi:hypothetical protein